MSLLDDLRALLDPRSRGNADQIAPATRTPLVTPPGIGTAAVPRAELNIWTELSRTETFTDISGVTVADCKSMRLQSNDGRVMELRFNKPSDA